MALSQHMLKNSMHLRACFHNFFNDPWHSSD
jgi:hypothetical protein